MQQEHAGEIGSDHRFPGVERKLFDRHFLPTDACVVEEQVQSPEGFLRAGEQVANGILTRHVRLHGESLGNGVASAAAASKGFVCFSDGLFETIEPTAGEHDVPAIGEQREGGDLADATAGAGDDGNLLCGVIHASIVSIAPRNSTRVPRQAPPLGRPRYTVSRVHATARRLISWSRVTSTRHPDAPMGWPSAIAPPFTFTLAGSSSSPS